ncbi:hypothetical protein ACFOWX_11850 [Sphingorhabdus arenilitoris]|uniref:Metal-dependent hydrolase n=1 Tax=Sphingorhabdus arenilitoris TaxID=1490041 RepID=A0ABV8RIT5_9SPHN
MFIGHYAPALIAAAHPKAPRLGVTFIAAQLVDLAFFAFVLTGTEKMRVTPGLTEMSPLDFYHMPYTHSLAGGIIFAAVMAWVIYYFSRSAAAAIIGGAVVVSHWFVDLLVHAPDLTLFGGPPKLGLALWDYPLIEMPLELGITGAALGYYYTKVRARDGAWVGGVIKKPLLSLGGVMLVLQLYSWLSSEPAEVGLALPLTALAAYGLFIWLAFRVDWARRQEN